MGCRCGCDCDDNDKLTLDEVVQEAKAFGVNFATEEFRKELERAIRVGDTSHALILVSSLEWTRRHTNGDAEYKNWLSGRERELRAEREQKHWAEVGTWVI